MTVTGQYHYPDNVDAFSREPFVVRFKAPKTGQFSDTQVYSFSMMRSELLFKHINLFYLHSTSPPPSACSAIKEFVLIPQHTTPANTTKELDALYDVLQHVRKMWQTEVTRAKQHRQ